MKILLKITAIALLPLVGLVVLAVVLAWVYIDRLVESGVERGATYALAVPTTLGSADVGVLSGSVHLAALEVSNPEGFESPHFLKLGDASVDVSLNSLMGDTVEVPSLVLRSIDVRLERTVDKANYKIILDNLSRFEGGGKSEPDPSGKKFVISTIEIRDVTVHADVVPIGGAIGDLATAKVTLDEVVLRDVGTAGKPMSMAEISAVVLKAILASAVEIGGGVLPEDVLGDIGAQLASMLDLGEMGVGDVEGLGRAAGDLLGVPVGETIDGVKDAVEDAGEQAQDAVEDAQKMLEEEARRARERLRGIRPGQQPEPK